jgi:hypothetical protein
MDIDKQRIAVMRALDALGYTYQGGQWLPPVAVAGAPLPFPFTFEADAMRGALMRWADALAGCTENSREEAELEEIIGLIEAYEGKRWPLGREPGSRSSPRRRPRSSAPTSIAWRRCTPTLATIASCSRSG